MSGSVEVFANLVEETFNNYFKLKKVVNLVEETFYLVRVTELKTESRLSLTFVTPSKPGKKI